MNTHPVRLIIDGNIFQPESGVLSVIGHGVNLQGIMGGFAGLVSARYPEATTPYLHACQDGALELGQAMLAPTADPELHIAHIVSQRLPGPDARLEALSAGLVDLYAQMPGLVAHTPDRAVHVRLPLIGAGIGGIDPMDAARTVFDVAENSPRQATTTLYLLSTDTFTPEVAALHATR